MDQKETKSARKIRELSEQLARSEAQKEALETQLASRLVHAFDALPKCGEAFFGSGVIVSIHTCGGKEIVRPFMVRDGLSLASIKALQADACLSFEKATLVPSVMATFRKKFSEGC